MTLARHNYTKARLNFWPKGGYANMGWGRRYSYNLRKLEEMPHHALCSVAFFGVPPCNCFQLYAPMIFKGVVATAREPVPDRPEPSPKALLCRLWDVLRVELGQAGLAAILRFTKAEWLVVREGIEGFLKLGDLYHGLDQTPPAQPAPTWDLGTNKAPQLLTQTHLDFLFTIEK